MKTIPTRPQKFHFIDTPIKEMTVSLWNNIPIPSGANLVSAEPIEEYGDQKIRVYFVHREVVENPDYSKQYRKYLKEQKEFEDAAYPKLPT